MVNWTKNGEPVDKKRVNVRSTERDSILFIRAAERDDSGVYEMSVKVEDFEDKASFVLQIVGEQNAVTALKMREILKHNTAPYCGKWLVW